MLNTNKRHKSSKKTYIRKQRIPTLESANLSLQNEEGYYFSNKEQNGLKKIHSLNNFPEILDTEEDETLPKETKLSGKKSLPRIYVNKSPFNKLSDNSFNFKKAKVSKKQKLK